MERISQEEKASVELEKTTGSGKEKRWGRG